MIGISFLTKVSYTQFGISRPLARKRAPGKSKKIKTLVASAATVEGHGDDAMRDGLDGFYFFSVPAIAWLFGRPVRTIKAVADQGMFGAPHIENGRRFYPIFMMEKYFERSISLNERKAAVKAMTWLDDAMQNWSGE